MEDPASRFEWESFARRECSLIAINLFVLSTLFLIHIAFASIVGELSFAAYMLFIGRISMQVVEWLVLSSGVVRGTARLARIYGAMSIILHLVFAGTLSAVSEIENSHYVALVLVPVIAAAFRLSMGGLVLTVLGAGALAFVEVYYYYQRHPPSQSVEYFEAATVTLVYVVAASVARRLVHELRRRETRLRNTIRELAQAQGAVIRAERLAAVGQLASALAHEIRNPVAMIAASLRRARAGDSTRPRDELIGIAGAEAEKLEKLTSDFLEYARSVSLALRPYSLSAIATTVADLASASAEESGVQLRVEADADPIVVSCDPSRLHRAVLNLVRNAIEATDRGGTVTLRVRADGNNGLLSVSNPGGPIPPEMTARLFEPFATAKAGGVGLGLSIARSIVRAHGGEILLAENTHACVRFDMTVPLERSTEPWPAS